MVIVKYVCNGHKAALCEINQQQQCIAMGGTQPIQIHPSLPWYYKWLKIAFAQIPMNKC